MQPVNQSKLGHGGRKTRCAWAVGVWGLWHTTYVDVPDFHAEAQINIQTPNKRGDFALG